MKNSKKIEKVTITLEVTPEFVNFLKTTIHLKGLDPDQPEDRKYTRCDPIEVLALVTLMEARGCLADYIYANTPLEWRDSIWPKTDERYVTMVDGQTISTR